ncbi:MAG: hypothetical protein KGD67_11495, partial [Candidatus Lokiarchaeota archaeon]|nr:hypothetical protein [Candidatus Lokiarchaeota archaeon]
VNTIKNLLVKYQGNTLNENFFRKALRNAVKGLLKINISLKEKGLLLSKVLKDMDFVKEYNTAVRTIDKVLIINPHKENFELLDGDHSHFSKSIKSSILELPGITSEITTSFITLMDALKLVGLGNSALIMKLFKELNKKGKTIIVVTHNLNLIKYASKVLKIRDGKLEDRRRK